jgi:signal transduction histidine kinase
MGYLTAREISLLFAFVLNFGLGSLVYLKDSSHRRVNISFSIFTWALACWILSVAMSFLPAEPAWRLFWARMSFVSSSFVPSAFFYFALIFPKEKRDISTSKIGLIFLLSCFFGLISFTKLMVHSADWETVTLNYGIAHRFFSIYLLAGMFGGIFFLIKSYRNSAGLERIQIKYCLLGVFIMTILGVTFNLIIPMIRSSRLSHFGPVSSIIMVSLIAYAILKYRLMDVDIVLKKGTTYFLLILLLFLPSCLLVVLTQKFLFKEVNYPFSAIMFSLLLIVAFFFHQIKPGTEKAVEHLLFKDRYDYRETLGRFSKAMVTILDLNSLSQRIIETITQAMGVEKASLFLIDEEKEGYFLLGSRNIAGGLSMSPLPKTDPLPDYLRKIREIIIREELIKGAKMPELNRIIQQMSALEAEVSIPLISKRELIGMINLSHKFNKDIYSQEDIELLSTLANQAAIAMENSRLYEDLKKSKSYIRRTDRLASLGILTAGLAHEIRNPLVAIKTFTQLLPERIEDDEFRNHFLNIASAEVDRISSLVNELLEFARPSEPKLEPEDINIILDGMILLVSTETKKKNIQVHKHYATDLPHVQVDREQMKQVFLNVLLNAIEATPENGKITVKTRSFAKPGGEPFVQIEFTDTGRGIPIENLEDIFTPFFTTKNRGGGLGLSISNQIVQDHKGYIDVESQLNKGSSFFVNLPVDQDYPKRRRGNDVNDGRQTFNSLGRR